VETESSLKLIPVKACAQGEKVNSKAGKWIARSLFPFGSDVRTAASFCIAQMLEFLL